MDAWLLVLLILAGLLVLAGMVVGLVFLILIVVQQLGGTAGGLHRLAQIYPAQNSASSRVVNRATVKIGAVVYKRCVAVGISDEGLYISTWGKSALIPWNEFKNIAHATLYWQKVPMLTVGDPPVATIIVPASLFDLMRSRLPIGLKEWS